MGSDSLKLEVLISDLQAAWNHRETDRLSCLRDCNFNKFCGEVCDCGRRQLGLAMRTIDELKSNLDAVPRDLNASTSKILELRQEIQDLHAEVAMAQNEIGMEELRQQLHKARLRIAELNKS